MEVQWDKQPMKGKHKLSTPTFFSVTFINAENIRNLSHLPLPESNFLSDLGHLH